MRSAARTNFSSARTPLRAKKRSIAMTAGKTEAICKWKFMASGANCLLTTTIVIYHNKTTKMLPMHNFACKGRRLNRNMVQTLNVEDNSNKTNKGQGVETKWFAPLCPIAHRLKTR